MSQSKSSQPHVDWLPLIDAPILTKPLHLALIKSHKTHDWFFNLAWAMKERKANEPQAKMFAKMYIFCYDHGLPGLSGSLNYIRGDDVMNLLLSHLLSNPGDQSTSRHRITRKADVALTDLETYMTKGNTWKEAVDKARAEAGSSSRDGGNRPNDIWRVPVLYSPAHLLSILIISYPDTKFKDRIQRLGIEWMMQDRNHLSVQDGYWRGIENKHLDTYFAPEDGRIGEHQSAKDTFLINYRLLFGDQYSASRKDMRPFLPAWAEDLVLEEEPILIDTSVEVNDVIEETTRSQFEVEASQLGTLLATDKTRTQAELGRWLINKLIDVGDIISRWCTFWAEHIRSARHLEEQLILQSLFQQSLRRLETLWASDTPGIFAEAYMIVDMEDAQGQQAKQHGNQTRDVVRRLEKNSEYMRCMKTHAQLRQLLQTYGQATQELVAEKISTRLPWFFDEVMSHGLYHEWANDVIRFESLRTQVIVQTIPDRVAENSNAEDGKAVTVRNRLLDDKTVYLLHLTKWQSLELLVPGVDIRHVLTEWQHSVYCKIYSVEHCISAPAHVEPITPQDPELGTFNDEMVRRIKGGSELFRTLFGNFHQPYAEKYGANLASLALGESPPLINTIPQSSVPSLPLLLDSTFHTPSRNHVTEFSASSVAHSSTTSQSHPHRASPTITPSRNVPILQSTGGHFAGRKSTKRGLSPNTTRTERNPKAIRLGDFTRDDMVQILDVYKQELKADIKSEIQAESVTSTAQYQAILEAMKCTILEISATIERSVKKDADRVDSILEHIRLVKDSLSSIEQGQAAQTVDVRGGLQALGATLQQGRTLEAVEAIKRNILTEISDLKACLAPRLGGEGYLVSHCPPPIDWQQNSAAWESRLLRAGWYYLHEFGGRTGCPDDGVERDQEVFQATNKKFPDLSEDYILLALQHVHIQAYGRPLPD
ncbi:hypothetical protein NUW58_g34 [Xylaria curta]|uniref:Uncharacterized protein n=1 Tax=Xylaria curta TaxID=42375 RepID=A0ACC1PTN1_9PEZI|nr:hypothetical protein NUW58_g34 [Xylaria curta]